jgi:hypothetical protein
MPGFACLSAALAAFVAAFATAQVTVELVSFGVGDVHRPGDFAGVRVAVTSGLAEAVTAEITLEGEDANGDIVEYVREVPLNPGQRVERWIYPRLPPSSRPDIERIWPVRVYRVEDGERVREIGAARFTAASGATPSFPVAIDQDLVQIVGDRPLGLETYGVRAPGEPFPVGLACVTHIAVGIAPREFPDRWLGWSSAQAVVWSGPESLPTQLGEDQARALLEWIRRGGTLVLTVPESQDAWGFGRPGVHPLSELVADLAPVRHEAVPLREVLPVLGRDRTLRDPSATTRVSTFAADSLPAGVRPVLAMPCRKAMRTGFLTPRPGSLDGQAIAVERRFGHGRVVVVGLDLDAINGRALQSTPLPQADVFWNRILGRRGDTPSIEELTRLLEADPPRATTRSVQGDLGSGGTISGSIGMSGRAALGVLAAVGLFGSYWLLAGPLGFAILKKFRRERLSWVAFAGCAFLFTAIAWAGGLTLGRNAPVVRHLTVIDAIAAEGGATSEPGALSPGPRRTHGWFSAFLPGYGPAEVALGGEGSDGDALWSWSPPPDGSLERYPSPDRTRVPFAVGPSLPVPSRATTSDFAYSRLGPIDPAWGRLPAPIEGSGPIELRIDRTQEPARIQLAGAIAHRLPGPLVDVTVIMVSPFRTPLPMNQPGPLPAPSPATVGEAPSYAFMAVVPRWEAGVPLDLARGLFTGEPVAVRSGTDWSFSREVRARFYQPLLQTGWGFMTPDQAQSPEQRRRNLEALGLYWMLQPPRWTEVSMDRNESARALRQLGRELDLSPWFLRPGLIVTGFLEGARSPVPVLVDGEEAASEGTTLVRWICPLAAPIDGLVPAMAAPAEGGS